MSQPTQRPVPQINLRGAVDLAGLKRPPPGPGGPAAAAAAGVFPGEGAAGGPAGVVVDVTEATFGGVVQLSMTVPVVVDLWATWCEPCKQLSPVLERLATEYAGRFLLAKVDVDENPQISAAFQVQSIPSVVAILKGQPVPLFQGAYPEAQVRQIFDELLRVAAENGVTGTVPGGQIPVAEADEEPVEEPLPPLHAQAYEAIERDDLEAAAAAYEQALAQDPADGMAEVGLGQVRLLQRTAGADVEAARAAAAAAPQDVEVQLLVADLDVAGGLVEAAFARLVDLVRATSGDERERARTRLVELFQLVGGDDPRVISARRALASALF